jgi:bla regulator protein BlaR1
MLALFVFLLKVNIALIAFCLGYYLVLRKLTFYTLNRAYLGLGIIFSSVYPLIDLSDFLQRYQRLAVPVQRMALNWKAPAEQLAQQPGYWYWATVIFWLGAIVFAMRLLVQLFSLYKLYRNSEPDTIQGHAVRVTDTNISPFSFWQNIYINPDNIDNADLPSILRHEQIHVKEWHTLDILLAEISVIFYWFNPGVWLMKKAVRENIEFITDRKILQLGADTKAYQYSLLNVSIAATTSAGITNHFNFSTLKKRIKMMNAKRSSNVNLTRYAFLVPTVLICLFVFSISKAELVKKTKVAYKAIANSVTKVVADKYAELNTTNDERIVSSLHIKDTIKIKATKITVKKDGHDSTLYTVNGKPVNESEFKKLHPNELQSIRIIDNDNDTTGGKNNKIVSIVTKGGNKGMTLVSNGSPVTMVRINGVTDTSKKTIHFTYHDDKDTSKTKVYASEIKFSYSTDNNSNGQKITAVTLSPPSSYTNFDGKLIMIDGKEASAKEMKKLSASDIESVKVDQTKELEVKYGDKAKNGVIYITTKKAKK